MGNKKITRNVKFQSYNFEYGEHLESQRIFSLYCHPGLKISIASEKT